ncbi:MAG: protein-L-isoaspartate O-methyltransferase [Rhodanobacter sp.]|jgi:protein-L-isoaspartate(D-aspartate) O-methyltransferase|nr:protein-L-isoaspartate O-methyltransferase [Rhodanobacter sp.]
MLTNIELARQNMVENQIRPWEVLDARVLETLRSVHREDFVGEPHRALAFADIALPIGHGEVMFKPIIEGRILQALVLDPRDRVLEIGTGSGFLTACLARLADRVVSIEQHADLAAAARARLAAAQMHRTHVEVAEAVRDFSTSEPFDAVVVGGAVHALPERFRHWVKPGGRLFAIIGESPVMQAILFKRMDESNWQEESLFETDLPYLRNAEPPRRFSF